MKLRNVLFLVAIAGMTAFSEASGQSVRLTYESVVSPAAKLPSLTSRQIELVNGTARVQVDLSPDRLRIRSHEAEEIIIEIRGGQRVHVDHANRRVSRSPLAVPRPAPKRTLLGTLKRTGESRNQTVAGIVVKVEKYEIARPGALLEVWITRDIAVPGQALKIWKTSFLPDEGGSADGVPISVSMVRGGTSVFSMTLKEISRTPSAIAVPTNYQEITSVPRSKLREEFARSTSPSGATSVRRTATVTRAAAAETPAPVDYAWMTKQPFLDRIKSMVNQISKGFTRFSGDANGGAMHLNIDWWAQLEPDLRFQNHEQAVATLKKGWFAYRVNTYRPADTSKLVGLTTAERATYDTFIADLERRASLNADWHVRIQECFDQYRSTSACRILLTIGYEPSALASSLGYTAFPPLFPQATIDRLVEREFSVIAAKDVSFGLTETAGSAGDVVGYELWDFDIEVTIDRDPLLDTVEFYGGGINSTFAIKQIWIDFQYVTYPADTWESLACGILTGGACTVLSTNYGVGYANSDAARVRVNSVFRRADDGTITLLPTVDETASQLDFSAGLLGLNLGQDIITAIAGAIASILDAPNSAILDGLETALRGSLRDVPMNWLANWNASQGPPAVQNLPRPFRIGSDRGLLVEGFTPEIVEGGGAATATGGIVDLTFGQPFGFAFSADYLEDWANTIMGNVAESSLPSPPQQTDFNIPFPDLSSLSLPSARPTIDPGRRAGSVLDDLLASLSDQHPYIPPGCARPAAESPRRVLRYRITRSRPEVALPPTGNANYAGMLRFQQKLVLEAVQTRSEPKLGKVTPRRCRRVDFGELPPIRAGEIPTAPPGGSRDPGLPPQPPTFPPFGEVPLQADVVCEPAKCHWFYVDEETLLKTYLDAEVPVEAKLQVGFDGHGEMWIPSINLRALEDGNDVRLTPSVGTLRVEAPFDQVPRTSLEDIVKRVVVTDLRPIARPLSESVVYSYRTLLSDLYSVAGIIPAELDNLFMFHQVPASGTTYSTGDPPLYTVSGDMLYWPIMMEETVSNHLP
jgi:hypothetical protein